MTFEAALPDARPCIGCGAPIRYCEAAAPGSRAMFHPAPVCEHLRSMLRLLGIVEPPDGDGFLMLDSEGEER